MIIGKKNKKIIRFTLKILICLAILLYIQSPRNNVPLTPFVNVSWGERPGIVIKKNGRPDSKSGLSLVYENEILMGYDTQKVYYFMRLKLYEVNLMLEKKDFTIDEIHDLANQIKNNLKQNMQNPSHAIVYSNKNRYLEIIIDDDNLVEIVFYSIGVKGYPVAWVAFYDRFSSMTKARQSNLSNYDFKKL